MAQLKQQPPHERGLAGVHVPKHHQVQPRPVHLPARAAAPGASSLALPAGCRCTLPAGLRGAWGGHAWRAAGSVGSGVGVEGSGPGDLQSHARCGAHVKAGLVSSYDSII